MDTLGDVRRDVAKYVGDSGSCPDDPRVVQAINDARRVLYPLGDWKGTVQPICLVSSCGIVTLPSRFEYIKQIGDCDRPVAVQNGWFTTEGVDQCGRNWRTAKVVPGEFCTFSDWPLTRGACKTACYYGFYVNVVFEDERDKDVVIRMQAEGTNHMNFSLTRVCRGAWIDHKANPGEDEAIRITSVIKPKTHGRVRVYGYDGSNNILLGYYERDDVNPTYLRYQVGGRRAVMAKAKKKFIKLDNDDQPVDIATEALIHALQALTDRENRNPAGFNTNLGLATGFLNKQLSGPQSTATTKMRISPAYRVTGLVE